MTRLSAAARRLIQGLATIGRRRVRLPEIRRAFLKAAPDALGAPDQRDRLAGLLHDLASVGRIRLPAGPRNWDRSAIPPLPRSVLLPPRGEKRPRAEPDTSGYPWRPELAFAGSLPMDGRAFAALRKINEWLRDRDGPRLVVPARERSLEIFGDEKALDRLSRTVLFGPGRLGFALLDCEPLSPPFVFAEVGPGETLLVAENHDTFHSLKTVLAERETSVGFVGYGAGKAFLRSVTHAAALPRPVRRILYFGDLDAPGLRIPIRAGRRAEKDGLPPVEPAPELYRLLLEIGRPAPYPYPPAPGEADALLAWLPPESRADAGEILLSGRRIAQEWVGLRVLSNNPFLH